MYKRFGKIAEDTGKWPENCEKCLKNGTCTRLCYSTYKESFAEMIAKRKGKRK